MCQNLDNYPRVEVLSESGDSAGSGWVLYLADTNDDCNGMDVLEYQENIPGFGDVKQLPKPTTGSHKMSEDHVNTFGFTEVLALDSLGDWVRCSRTDGEVFTAEAVFNKKLLYSLDCVFSGDTSTFRQTPTNRPYGPIIFDMDPTFKGSQWMWLDSINSCGTGAVRGSSSDGWTIGSKLKWWWYGRNAETQVRIL